MDFTTAIMTLVSPTGLVLALGLAMLAGLVKGIVGFAMPTVLISGLSSFLAPEVALAALILPTLLSNGVQALRQGWPAALQAIRRFRIFLVAGLVLMVFSAQLVAVLPQRVMFLIIGIPVTVFGCVQLAGWSPRAVNPAPRVEAAVGALAGFVGGMSGIWGPPTAAYLTAINTPKAEQMRIQGVIYGLGAVVLLLAHSQSGILRADTAQLSALLILPALVGMAIGFRIQDRIDQVRFKQVTLAVLIIAGLNLIRRGLF